MRGMPEKLYCTLNYCHIYAILYYGNYNLPSIANTKPGDTSLYTIKFDPVKVIRPRVYIKLFTESLMSPLDLVSQGLPSYVIIHSFSYPLWS